MCGAGTVAVPDEAMALAIASGGKVSVTISSKLETNGAADVLPIEGDGEPVDPATGRLIGLRPACVGKSYQGCTTFIAGIAIGIRDTVGKLKPK